MQVPRVEFRLLGPVQVCIDGVVATLTGKQRALAATLLIEANHVVSTDRIASCLWGDALPSSPAPRVRSLVSELRRSLGTIGADRLRTVSPGYSLSVLPGELDVASFDARLQLAKEHVRQSRTADALASYNSALSLWRGAPLDNIEGLHFSMQARHLEEQHIGALESRAQVKLALGRVQEAISELRQVTDAVPFRESPVRHLMLALHQSGRTAEALNTYHSFRTGLVRELGIEPSAELSDTQQRILKGEGRNSPHVPEATVAPLRRTPQNLPMGPPRLVGRAPELACLAEQHDQTTRVVLIVGPAGVGKSALAVHWARQVVEDFPDGQLYLEMRGFDHGQPCTPAEALPQLLQALGHTGRDIPLDFQEQLALYRSSLAGKKCLLLLDDVANASQVRPLIAAGSGSVVIVTSRDRLGGLVALEGAERLTLEALDSSEAVRLIALRAGDTRVHEEQEAAKGLAELCGRLPLALCIVGAQLADHPHRTIQQHTRELMADGPLNRLRVDSDSQAAVHPALEASYNALSEAAQRMLHLLPLVPGNDLSATAAAALAGASPTRAAELLDSISRIHLTTEIAARRYSCHDLVLEYAREKAKATGSASGEEAVRRLYDFYLHSLINANRVSSLHQLSAPYDPPSPEVAPEDFEDAAMAYAWITSEWDNIAAMITHAVEQGPYRHAWLFVAALQDVYHHRRPLSEWIHHASLALSAAEHEDDSIGQSAMHRSLASALWRTGDLNGALTEYEQALDFARQANWRQGECAALMGSGVARKQLGDAASALPRYRRAHEISVELDDRRSQAIALSNLASAHLTLSQLNAAEQLLMAARPLALASGHRHLEALVLSTWGHVQQKLARLDEAAGTLEESIAVARSIGSSYAEAASLETLGRVHHDAGRYEHAVVAFEQALDITRTVGNRNCEVDALVGLAATQMRLGDPLAATKCLATARETAERTGHAAGLAEALLGQAELAVCTGALEEARERASDALALASATLPLALPRAHYVMALVLRGLAIPEEALEHCRESLALCRRSSQRLLQVRVLITLGRTMTMLERMSEASTAWQEAQQLVAALDAPERAEVERLLLESATLRDPGEIHAPGPDPGAE
ncbi:BTAD domain-containing putative transcriptional regulator [Streptomyces sp. N2A]|uniref:AfsR/SARP family transcriptional regulator n=1 Tax=Streptomyces sp. N2A TaxID=3073936 RepID=UPI002870B0FB|nr:BTAD domain-containing putative transcriptional regulator [Streptomyces sp. N2A]